MNVKVKENMMIGIILATHGRFSEGILQSASMILGEQENLTACALLPEMGPEDIHRQMEKAVSDFDDPDQILILADLWGGTPFNQANALIAGHEEDWAIVTGMNLPMVIEAVSSRMFIETAKELSVLISQSAKEGVRIYPEVQGQPAEEKTSSTVPASQPQGSIPEGTVLGDGHIKYVLARVDTRLLHGQVATTWTKQTKPDRIIVVSDNVARDDLRKRLIMEAAPPGVKAHVVPVDKMIKVAADPRFGATKAMLLFETPQDALRAVEGGVDLKELNIGSMAHKQGKIAVSKAVSLDNDDIKTFEKLKEKGIVFDVRKVPGDSRENMDNMLNQAKKEL